MNNNTMKLLVEYIADQNRREKERNSITYSAIYNTAITDTNGVEQDWQEKDDNNQ